MSACISTYEVWSRFSEDWSYVLNQHPRASSFHVREARSKQKQFAGWKTIDVDNKIIALTEVIVRHEPHVVTCWLSEVDYNETVRTSSVPDIKHAYFTYFSAIVIKACQYQEHLGIHTPVDFIFDEHGDIGNEALMWHFALREGQPEPLHTIMGTTPVFRDDEDVLPLQAADLIAWHKRRRKEFIGLDAEVAASLRVDELPGAEIAISRSTLQAIADKNAALPGVRESQGNPSIYKQLKSAYRKRNRLKL